MFIDPRPIDSTQDAHVRIRPLEGFDFCAGQQTALLGTSEIIPSALNYPVLFAGTETEVTPVALLGTNAEHNAVVADDGSWKYGYVPAVFRCYPFALMQTDDEGKTLAVCLDRSSAAVVDEEPGQKLFADEQPSAYLKRVKELLAQLHKDQQNGSVLGRILIEMKLLEPFAVSIKSQSGEQNIDFEGLYRVSEEALNKLDDKKFLDLRSLGVLASIYAHLNSLRWMQRVYSPISG